MLYSPDEDHARILSGPSDELLVSRIPLMLQTVIGRQESELIIVKLYALNLWGLNKWH